MEKLKILVVCHKADPYIKTDPPYLPIHAGAALHPDLNLGFQKDNEDDNISEKNPRWCELTALYWGWKNIKDVEYIGLCHYRRYFDKDISKDNIDTLLKGKDIILLDRIFMTCNVQTRMQELTTMEDYHIFIDTLLKFHPDYKKAVLDYCCNSYRFIRCTMFITKKEIYDDFCETFFPVFSEVEKIIKPHGYTRLNRCVAYFGELSLGIYVTHNKLKRRYLPMKAYGDIVKNNSCAWLNRVNEILVHPVKVFILRTITRRNHKLSPYDAVAQALKNQGINLDCYIEE